MKKLLITLCMVALFSLGCTQNQILDWNLLKGTQWVLTKLILDGQPFNVHDGEQGKTTISFPEFGKVGGNGGVNVYGGTYAINHSGEIVWNNDFVSTKMMGPLILQESMFIVSLVKINQFELKDNLLILKSSDNRVVMEFKPL